MLQRSGEDVTAVARPASAERLARDGLTVIDPTGTHHTTPAVAAVPANGSAVIVAAKAFALPNLLPAIAAAEPSEVLFLQNGVAHLPLVHAALPNCDRVACGAIKIVATRGEDGIIRQPFPMRLVEVPDVAAEWEITRALTAAGVETTVAGTESQVLWRKFRFLSALALATSWRDAPIGAAMDAEPGVIEAMASRPTMTSTCDSSNQLRRWPRRPSSGRRRRSTSGAHRNLKEYIMPALAIMVMSFNRMPSSLSQ